MPGVNHLGYYDHWAFAEFTEVFQIESDFKSKVDAEFKGTHEHERSGHPLPSD
ncbi:MAG: hypothetical protein K9K38_06975 [Rhodoferax sp.]|nr:hypothetical protein [Rhodoferax sp.]MCF8209130.1 hypothetical protein [Rhodoferax sp.]